MINFFSGRLYSVNVALSMSELRYQSINFKSVLGKTDPNPNVYIMLVDERVIVNRPWDCQVRNQTGLLTGLN